MTADLFADLFNEAPPDWREDLAPGAVVLRGFALPMVPALLAGVEAVTASAPFRHLVTPGGQTMSVAMSNTGALGWVSDRRGYRYDATDPQTGRPWPAMPAAFAQLALDAAHAAGFDGFTPQACLINRYAIGARLSLHQDKDELDYDHPIVSVSLGLPAVFLFGGFERSDRQARIPIAHGDVVVWGGPSRLRYHGVQPIKPGVHPLLGDVRINLTFRKVR
ncbi:DNA oxidative demethylase AlkB [Jeongeupia chitinilytica]|uniref:Alpha-ketoglutarate-dependent dioxygenase AlkB n=1 Tax=Jeongeupia chitinilytica TaxID=1041641 RepID=A0ABQ3GX39_9NEIS|nr:DNA oxidative demethylase AlkB [Jeongeupia chitinilytica]GHD56560.1 alpha-ketoglutarate-dependent dioxygenase AlkB [Jeongeupia chitinilytica]